MFSLVCALPSPDSAEACASLFDRFTGTTAQSDFSCTCMSAVWFMAFADRSCSFEQDVQEISRFSCMWRTYSQHLVHRGSLHPFPLRKILLQVLNGFLQVFGVVGALVPAAPQVVSRFGNGISLRVLCQEP